MDFTINAIEAAIMLLFKIRILFESKQEYTNEEKWSIHTQRNVKPQLSEKGNKENKQVFSWTLTEKRLK